MGNSVARTGVRVYSQGMTKTTTTVSETTTPNGEQGWRIECTCKTHKAGQTVAIVKRHGASFDRKLVHGWVLGLHTDGIMRAFNGRQGKAWPA